MANSSTASWILLGFGAAISLLNWVYVYLSWRTGRSHSLIPLIGGVCLLTGALSVTSLRPFAWVAVFADAGTIVVFLAIPLILWEAWRTCPLNLLGEFVELSGKTTIRLRLFRRGVFTIHWQIERLAGEYGLISRGRIGSWEQQDDSLILRDGNDRAAFQRPVEAMIDGWLCVADFAGTETMPELALSLLEGHARQHRGEAPSERQGGGGGRVRIPRRSE
jgi:hypothetical protein